MFNDLHRGRSDQFESDCLADCVYDAFAGFLILVWLALVAAGSLILDGFRGDSVIVLGSLRTAQLLNLAVLMTALAGLHVLARRKPPLSDRPNPD